MRKKVFIALKMAGIAGQEKLAGIFRFLGDSHDWAITLIRTTAEFTPACVAAARKERFDGFIISLPNSDAAASQLAEIETPTIVMDLHDPRLARRRTNIVFICNSAERIGCAAADFLVSTGRCRSYAFVQNPSVAPWSKARFAAFERKLHERGLWCHHLESPDGLETLPRPIGVFAANDDRGYDVLEHCRNHHIRVPDEALVLGTNNDTLICENCRPHLSSIQPDFNEEGFLAAKTLDAMMRHKRVNLQKTLEVGVRQIIRRESTNDTSPSGKLVQRALVYLRRHALRGIGVDDVVRHLGCSRRLADLRFRELQGTTIGETLISFRLSEVKRRLATTLDPIDQIAADCGYENPNYLKNLFKRRFGLTMREWRKRAS